MLVSTSTSRIKTVAPSLYEFMHISAVIHKNAHFLILYELYNFDVLAAKQSNPSNTLEHTTLRIAFHIYVCMLFVVFIVIDYYI